MYNLKQTNLYMDALSILLKPSIQYQEILLYKLTKTKTGGNFYKLIKDMYSKIKFPFKRFLQGR